MKIFQALSAVGLILILPAAARAGSYSSSSKGSYSQSSDGWLEEGGSDFEKKREQIKAGMKVEQPTVQSSSVKSASAVSSKDVVSMSSPSTIHSSGFKITPAVQKSMKKQADQKPIPYREQLQKALKEWTGKEGKVTSSGFPGGQTQAGADQK